MNLPVLYSSCNSCVIECGRHALNKHGKLLDLKENCSVLEIGTGDGKATIEILLPALPKNYRELVLTDKSKVMLEHAKGFKPLVGMEFCVLDVEAKEIPSDFENRFDFIYSNFTLHWIKDTRQAVQNMYKMLKPGGEIFCSFFTECPADSAWDALGKHPKWSQYDPNPFVTTFYNNPKIFEIYKSLLDESGFKISVAISEELHYEYADINALHDILVAINLSLKNIPKHLLPEYLEDYYELFKKDKYCSSKKLQDGKEHITVHFPLIVIYAKK